MLLNTHEKGEVTSGSVFGRLPVISSRSRSMVTGKEPSWGRVRRTGEVRTLQKKTLELREVIGS